MRRTQLGQICIIDLGRTEALPKSGCFLALAEVLTADRRRTEALLVMSLTADRVYREVGIRRRQFSSPTSITAGPIAFGAGSGTCVEPASNTAVTLSCA